MIASLTCGALRKKEMLNILFKGELSWQQNMPIQLALSITGVTITGGNGTLIVNRQVAV